LVQNLVSASLLQADGARWIWHSNNGRSKRAVIIGIIIVISALLAVGSTNLVGGRWGALRVSPINVLLADFAAAIGAVNSEVGVRGVTLVVFESPFLAGCEVAEAEAEDAEAILTCKRNKRTCRCF
jgi:hypothetical protein